MNRRVAVDVGPKDAKKHVAVVATREGQSLVADVRLHCIRQIEHN